MNCRRVQDLIAPYVDERLTGQQMLDVRRHLDTCRSCSAEHLTQRQVKIMLRTVAMKKPDAMLEVRLYSQIQAERQTPTFTTFVPSFTRGRRMAYAMALSCVTVLSLAHATSQKMAMDIASARPTQVDAEMSNGILTDLEGQNITSAFREPAGFPLQSAVFAVRHVDQPRPRRTYDLVGGFSSPMNMYGGAATFATYSTH